MRDLSITPSITVTIRRHTRIYFVYVITGALELNAPSTITLRAASLADVAGLATEEPCSRPRADACAIGELP